MRPEFWSKPDESWPSAQDGSHHFYGSLLQNDPEVKQVTALTVTSEDTEDVVVQLMDYSN